jgi:Ca2+-binding RTX toxin-like protein
VTYTGGAGNDTFIMQNAGDVIAAGVGTADTLTVSKAAILGGISVDLNAANQIVSFNGAAISGTITGFEDVDLSGYTGSFGAQVSALNTVGSTITGTANADVILGGTGADTLTGGDGVDTITGGSGNDTFTVGMGLGDLDVITDFAAGDKLALDITTPAANTYAEVAVGAVATTDELVVITGAGAANAAALYGAGTFAANSEVVIIFFDTDTNTAKLYYDADGENGGADGAELINFTGITSLTDLAAAFSSNADFTLT